MPHPCLLFCPYLPLSRDFEPILFSDWELGPLQSFEGRWADAQFKSQATTFLSKFTKPSSSEQIKNPALLCRKGRALDGQKPSAEEYRALEHALAFAFLDSNPKQRSAAPQEGWGMVTTDNMEVYLWPIDIEQGHVTLNNGHLVSVMIGGYTVDNVILTPSLDLHLPIGAPSPDPLVLTGIYETVLSSLVSSGTKPVADSIRVAVDWFAKAWRNTNTVHDPERLVFLKTAFEAITSTSNTNESACKLRRTFEGLSETTEDNSEILVWSPEETPIHTYTWIDKRGQSHTRLITDLQAWFMAFGAVRNTIIHEGKVPDLIYPNSNLAHPVSSRSVYHGHFFRTAEKLLRGTIKVMLSKLGFEEVWRTRLERCIRDGIADSERTSVTEQNRGRYP